MTELAKRNETMSTAVEQVVVGGDLSSLQPGQRVEYYRKVCESLGLNPFTKPFDYITLNGKLQLYARKDATEQLRKLHGVSITRLDGEFVDDLYIVHAAATARDGRIDQAKGAVSVGTLKGEAKANAIMKAETKAKRRVTLSICGLGWTDETEIDSIPTAVYVPVDVTTGEIVAQHRTARPPVPVSIENRSQIDTTLNEIDVEDSEPMAFDEEPPTKVRDWLATGDPVAEAKAWAVECRAQANDFAARNSLKKIVDAQGGRLTKDNMYAILTAYYFRQVEHLSDARGVAVA